MSIQYKAFLYERSPRWSKEIRRFSVDNDVSSSYEYLKQKVANIFPNLGNLNFSLQWRDTDGDLIWFNSDEELIRALNQLNGDVFKLYVKEFSADNQHRQDDYRKFCYGSFLPFDPEFLINCPYFNDKKCNAKACPEKANQSCEKPSTSNSKNVQDEDKSDFTGAEFVQGMVNNVTEWLQALGIDVDIDVRKRKKNKPSGGESTDQSPSTSGLSSQSSKKQPQKDAGLKSGEDMEVDKDTLHRESLKQLLAMGFNNQGGWLTDLLKANNYDIARALEALQPAHQREVAPDLE